MSSCPHQSAECPLSVHQLKDRNQGTRVVRARPHLSAKCLPTKRNTQESELSAPVRQLRNTQEPLMSAPVCTYPPSVHQKRETPRSRVRSKSDASVRMISSCPPNVRQLSAQCLSTKRDAQEPALSTLVRTCPPNVSQLRDSSILNHYWCKKLHSVFQETVSSTRPGILKC